MIRVVLENVVLFLLPSLAYIAYTWMMAAAPSDGSAPRSANEIIDDAPLLWLFATGAALVLLTLIAFGDTTGGGKPGQNYEPPSMKNGHIEPGHVE